MSAVQVRAFYDDAFACDSEVPTFCFDMSTRHRNANNSCITFARAKVKLYNIEAMVVTGAAGDCSSSPSYVYLYRKEGTVGDVDPFADVEVETARSFEDLWTIVRKRNPKRLLLQTNIGAGSFTFVKDRPITHINPGQFTTTTDLNVILQVSVFELSVWNVCHVLYYAGGRLLT